MAVSKKMKAIYNSVFDGIETFAANSISNFQEKWYLNKYIDKGAKLSFQQKKEIADYWAPYAKVSTDWTLYNSAKNDIFDPRYIPNDLYYTKIDQHFNARKLGYGFNDKTIIQKFF